MERYPGHYPDDPLVHEQGIQTFLRPVDVLGEVRFSRRLLGMFAIGLSGLMLWFPEFFSIFLPGWVLI